MSDTGLATAPNTGRAWRGAVLGLAGWYTVVAAHTLAARTGPSVGALIATGGLAALVGTGLGGRTWTWRRAFLALLLLQPTIHLALAAAAAGHHRHVAAPSGSASAMVLAHVIAAAVAALLVSRGEVAVRRLAALLATTWRRLSPLRAVCPAGPTHARPDRPRVVPAVAADVRWSLLRRGPPAVSAR